MNWFVFVVSVLYGGACVVDIMQERYVPAVIWFGYSLSGFALAKLGAI